MHHGLAAYGLTEKESKVYLALLELGTTTATRISQVTHLNRTTLYDILGGLTEKGIVSRVKQGQVTHFAAASPKRLLDQMEERARTFQESLTELSTRQNSLGPKPSIELYEGSQGVNAIYKHLLSLGKPIYGYGSFEIIEHAARHHTRDYRKQRVAKKIHTEVITDSTVTYLPSWKDANYRKYTKIYLDPSMKTMPVWTYIVGTTVAVISCSKSLLFGFLMNDLGLAKKELAVFERLKADATLFHKI